jgi:hypothetical protein
MSVNSKIGGGVGPLSLTGSYRMPATAADFAALTTKVPYGLWIGNCTTGSLIDRTNNHNDLSPVGSPTYRSLGNTDHVGIKYDSALNVSHMADVGNVEGSGWFIYGAIIKIETSYNNLQGFVGMTSYNLRPSAYAYIFTNVSPRWPNVIVQDNVSGTLQIAFNTGVDWIDTYPGEWLVQLQVDRETVPPVARCRISAGGGLIAEKSGSMTGIGSLSGSVSRFTFGASLNNYMRGGTTFYYGYYMTGSQCCGPTVLSGLASKLGYEP